MIQLARQDSPRLLITGASGFTGQHLTALAVQQGYRVHAMVQPGRAQELVRPDCYRVEAELTDASAMRQVLREAQPHYVIHLAAASHVANRGAEEIYLSNVVGSVILMEALASECPELKRVILASSANIYGNASKLPLTEDSPPQPVNDYALSKLAAEWAADRRRARLPLIIVRPFNYTGLGQSDQFLVPKIVSAFRRHEELISLGNIEVARDFSDVRDVVAAYLALLETRSKHWLFNICSGRSTRLQEILEIMQQLSGHTIRVQVDPALVRENEIRELYGSDVRLGEAIGSYRSYSLEDTLAWMYAGDTAS